MHIMQYIIRHTRVRTPSFRAHNAVHNEPQRILQCIFSDLTRSHMHIMQYIMQNPERIMQCIFNDLTRSRVANLTSAFCSVYLTTSPGHESQTHAGGV